VANSLGNESQSTAADEADVERLLSDSQWFLALDAAKKALERSPKNLKLQRNLARSLLKLGAAEEAKKILEPLCVPANLNDPVFISLFHQFRQSAAALLSGPAPESGPLAEPPARELLMTFADLVGVTAKAAERVVSAHAMDEETLGLLGSTYKELFKESGKLADARRSRDTYMRAFQATRGYWTCINAATMSLAVSRIEAGAGDPHGAQRDLMVARDLAATAAEICRRQIPAASGVNRFWLLATLGEALLHLGHETDAVAAYAQAAATKGVADPQRISAYNQLRLLRQWGLHIPEKILDSLKLPQVAIFVGHMIDQPGRLTPRFPPEMEGFVRNEIERHLADLEIRIAYGSAACGADMLFVEALQDREAEVNIVMPFDTDDFINTSVAFAGGDWVRRFRRALKLASKHVMFATAERYLGTVGLLAYANQIIQGLAFLRARSMGSEPYLLAVYDGSNMTLGGGTADVVSHWSDKKRLRVIELPTPSASVSMSIQSAEAATNMEWKDSQAPAAADRVVRAMLFADVVGFSTLPEEQVPYFMYEFLNEIAKHLKELPRQPRLVNTWGDAIFAVMDEALPMVDYARTLQRVVCATDWHKLGMPPDMSIRIGLHMGPVFEGIDAITQRSNCFGTHVNRAARIELVTVPGYIYASQSFVALLTSEQRMLPEPPGGWPFTCEFLGTLELAKNFGVLPTYYIRGRHGGPQAARAQVSQAAGRS
jgi:pilus assembly protein FimV